MSSLQVHWVLRVCTHVLALNSLSVGLLIQPLVLQSGERV